MSAPPLSQVKERFESKEKLIAAVEKLATDDLWLDRANDAKGLKRVSNAKLLRLHALLSAAKEQFGSRAKLIEAICGLSRRDKDAGFRGKMEGYPLPRLLDVYRSAERRSKESERKAAPEKKPRRAPAKAVPAKKAAPAKKAPPAKPKSSKKKKKKK